MHTRWIETDFANTLAAAVRSEPPAPDAALVRTAIEIDGRRMALGLPAELAARLAGRWRAVRCIAGAARAPVGAARPGIGRRTDRRHAAVVEGGRRRHVAQGDTIATMEAMKMEMQVTAHRAGRIALKAVEGAAVAAGAAIAVIGWRVTV